MPFARFSAESRIADRKARLRLTDTYISALSYKNGCAVSPTKLSLALSGNKALPAELGEKIVVLLDELITLQERCELLELAFTNAEKTTLALERMRNGEMFFAIVRDTGEVADVSADAEVRVHSANVESGAG